MELIREKSKDRHPVARDAPNVLVGSNSPCMMPGCVLRWCARVSMPGLSQPQATHHLQSKALKGAELSGPSFPCRLPQVAINNHCSTWTSRMSCMHAALSLWALCPSMRHWSAPMARSKAWPGRCLGRSWSTRLSRCVQEQAGPSSHAS